tara:strand:- start:26 stop:262 length:237 start_codon:yes stop_codon:yes gene_type:complete
MPDPLTNLVTELFRGVLQRTGFLYEDREVQQVTYDGDIVILSDGDREVTVYAFPEEFVRELPAYKINRDCYFLVAKDL